MDLIKSIYGILLFYQCRKFLHFYCWPRKPHHCSDRLGKMLETTICAPSQFLDCSPPNLSGQGSITSPSPILSQLVSFSGPQWWSPTVAGCSFPKEFGVLNSPSLCFFRERFYPLCRCFRWFAPIVLISLARPTPGADLLLPLHLTPL